MFSNSTTSAEIKQSIQTKLADNFGLDHISKSSVTSHIVDAISQPLADGINIVNKTLNSVYTNLAEGSTLTANAYDFGVIRNLYSDVYLTTDDQIVEVYMANGTEFPAYFEDRIVIPKGREITINNSTVIQFTSNVYLTPGQLSAYVSVKISTVNSSDIPIGTKIKIANDKEPITNGLVMSFREGVNFRLVQEDDEQLRRRTQIAKMRAHGSNEYSIMGWIDSIPTISEYKFQYNGGTNTYNIFIVTKNYKETFTDPNINAVIANIKSKLDMYIGAESKFSINYPELYKISFAYKYRGATPEICNAIIDEAFQKVYSYRNDTKVDVDNLKKEIGKYALDMELDSIIIYHDVFGIVTSVDKGSFEIPNMGLAVIDHSRTFAVEE